MFCIDFFLLKKIILKKYYCFLQIMEERIKTQNSSDKSPLLKSFFFDRQKFTQKLEYDTYLLTSLFLGFILPSLLICLIFWILFLLIILLSLIFFCLLFTKDCRKKVIEILKSFVGLPVMMFLFSILIIPGIFVVVLQLLTIGYLNEYINYTNPDNNFIFLKLGVIIIFLCLICKEISQAYNTLFYIISKFRRILDKITCLDAVFVFFSLLMPILQFCTAILLCEISLLVVIQTNSILDLVQNFAGFYVILEFDNIMFQFIDFLPWKNFFHFCYNLEIYGKITMRSIANRSDNFIEILLEDVIDFDKDLQTQKTDSIQLIEEKKEVSNNFNLETQKTQKADLDEKTQRLEHNQEIVFCYFKLFGGKAKYIILSKIILISAIFIYFIIDFLIST